MEALVERTAYFILAVVLHHKARSLGIKPMFCSATQCCKSLRIELAMVRGVAHINGSREFNAYKAAMLLVAMNDAVRGNISTWRP